ncbi:type VII secretion protein EccB [Yinghuangia aomiensis]|uniref:Type VII secretion protein EccB n=1 Tax=Yinghuangia aomiensis TaxID=676205 RepID=A0ABP9I2Y7_9ACTN
MASRREQLEAYVFARRRMVAGFLQPEPGGGTEEKAPRPFRSVLPGIVVGALILTGFGVYGLVQPGTPPGWKNKGSLIVGRDSASRYVYLDGKLHPVLNIASGRLLLDPGQFKVNLVPEKVLNSVDHGAPLGIPNAPDRLPTAKEVGKTKSWTVCERPATGKDGRPDPGSPQRSVFVGAPPKQGELGPDEAIFVQQKAEKAGDQEPMYVVEGGHAYLIKSGGVRSALVLDAIQPQPVTREWLDTLEPGADIDFPDVPDYGKPAAVALRSQYATVGLVLRAEGSGQYYVVLRDGVYPVSRLAAELLLARADARTAYGAGRTPQALPVNVGDLGDAIRPGRMFAAEKGWPERLPQVVNRIEAQGDVARTTLCNTYSGTYAGGFAQTRQSAWPALAERLVDGMGGVWVEPGTGALIREVTGRGDDQTGTLFLVTDSGLRYQIVNDPPEQGGSAPAGADGEAKVRLGYQGIVPTPVPRAWAALVPAGVRLSVKDAKQPQSS